MKARAIRGKELNFLNYSSFFCKVKCKSLIPYRHPPSATYFQRINKVFESNSGSHTQSGHLRIRILYAKENAKALESLSS